MVQKSFLQNVSGVKLPWGPQIYRFRCWCWFSLSLCVLLRETLRTNGAPPGRLYLGYDTTGFLERGICSKHFWILNETLPGCLLMQVSMRTHPPPWVQLEGDVVRKPCTGEDRNGLIFSDSCFVNPCMCAHVCMSMNLYFPSGTHRIWQRLLADQ